MGTEENDKYLTLETECRRFLNALRLYKSGEIPESDLMDNVEWLHRAVNDLMIGGCMIQGNSNYPTREALIPGALGRLSANVADLYQLVGEIEHVLGICKLDDLSGADVQEIDHATIQERARRINSTTELIVNAKDRLRLILEALGDL